jgi:hypothetical protein
MDVSIGWTDELLARLAVRDCMDREAAIQAAEIVSFFEISPDRPIGVQQAQ